MHLHHTYPQYIGTNHDSAARVPRPHRLGSDRLHSVSACTRDTPWPPSSKDSPAHPAFQACCRHSVHRKRHPRCAMSAPQLAVPDRSHPLVSSTIVVTTSCCNAKEPQQPHHDWRLEVRINTMDVHHPQLSDHHSKLMTHPTQHHRQATHKLPLMG